MNSISMLARQHYSIARATRLDRVGTSIPDGWDRVLENGYPTVWRRPYVVAVPGGWIDVMFALSEHLQSVGGWVDDTKEKFGALRLEVRSELAHIDNIEIELAYEELSMDVCQDCGKAGILRQDRGWWSTLCDKHSVTRDQR